MTDTARFPLTRALAGFATSLADVPAAALETATHGITDAVSLMLRARREHAVQAVCDLSLGTGRHAGASTVLLSDARSDAATAACINATAAHFDAMDDVAWSCHPSALLMPALLAVGEASDVTGEQLLRAWVVGYEVLGELVSREPGALHGTGWHPSALVGPIAVAAAVAHLLRLDADTAAGALATAASMTGGITANFGTPVKAWHAGRVAAAGVLACELAARGVRGSADALERAGGFLDTISPSGRADLVTPLALGPAQLRVLTTGLNLKRHPLCYSLHRVADAAMALAGDPALEVAAIERIDIALGGRQLRMAPHRQPTNPMQARYSAPFAVASGLLAGAAGFAQLDPAFVASAPVQRLIACTQLTPLGGTDPNDPVFAPADRVRVWLRDGRCLDSGPVRHPRGHARQPLDAEERRAKFKDCVAGTGVAQPDRLFDRLAQMASAPSVRALMADLRADLASAS